MCMHRLADGVLCAWTWEGLPLIPLGPRMQADITVAFQAGVALNGTYTYYFAVDGAHTGFFTWELYVNQVLVYTYSPLDVTVGNLTGPLGLFYPSVHLTLPYRAIPGWVSLPEASSTVLVKVAASRHACMRMLQVPDTHPVQLHADSHRRGGRVCALHRCAPGTHDGAEAVQVRLQRLHRPRPLLHHKPY